MTDYEQIEQKAKKYVNDKADTGNYDYALGDNVLFGKSALEKAYIAGAKENGVVWHDLRKDPNDLPVRRCIDNDGNVVGLFRHSWDKKSTWYRYDFHEREWWQMGTEPIAWCEIPTYTEE